ncbi:uncharacterized protein C1orf159 isoform X2 [Carcharodon carcharias]|uniref:uncharacterized protein C1orf159 isoform X2 n=1 Tax=Carcharodon carcharias TaxID=13397 RepID=UPI001B7E4426|nr:uncharacterized protein C1orf159 isoform X2 [Carcharodon carcharias]XP_041063015.1 uncharacterized protein C1orf159 isoform X2 [Carcharodon carcharias]XP_041063016.1 uncharacterized protein C1orf159 isoform X2 [Carcharodon carcharias]
MSVPFTIILAGLVLRVCSETPQSLIPQVAITECCADLLDESGLCPQNSFCHSDCYRHWFKNGSTTCIRCINGTLTDSSNNRTECINSQESSEEKVTNGTTVDPTILKIGGPGIAASLCLGTLFISSFFILSVAAFFYLKRSNKLPHLFYQRNKASILQPSEMAEMMRSPVRSERKHRYSRRERLSVSAASFASAAISNVHNVCLN